jgi:hypothetical protein
MLLSREYFVYMLRHLSQFTYSHDIPENTVRANEAEINRHFDPTELDDPRGVNEVEFTDLCRALNLPEIKFETVIRLLGDASRTDRTQPSAAFDPTMAIPSMQGLTPQSQPEPPPSSDEGMVMESSPPQASFRRRVNANPVVEFVNNLSFGQIGLLLLGLFFIVAIVAGLLQSEPTASGSQDPSGWMRPNANTQRIAPSPKEKP